jgi:hypothetical protein
VTVERPSPTAAEAAVCTPLMAALPQQVLDQDRRTVEFPDLTAAWGKPVITLRCGVPKPAALGAASQCFEVNGVGWFAEEAEGGYLFTTIGRAAYVELGVPNAYAPEATALVDVAAAVTAHDRLLKPCA